MELSSTSLHQVEKQEEERLTASSPSEARNISGIKWLFVVLSILTSTFFYGLDNTVAANVQPTIVNEFGALDRLPWISAAFLIGGASTNFFWYAYEPCKVKPFHEV